MGSLVGSVEEMGSLVGSVEEMGSLLGSVEEIGSLLGRSSAVDGGAFHYTGENSLGT